MKSPLPLLNLLFWLALSGSFAEANETVETLVELGGLELPYSAHGGTTITVSTQGRDYILQLHPSQAIAGAATTSSRYFQGSVLGDETSWVRLGIDGDRVSGYLKAFGELLELDHSSNASYRHSLRKVEIDHPAVSDGADLMLVPPVNPLNAFTAATRSSIESRAAGGSTGVTRVLRISIVVDSRFDEFSDGHGLDNAINIINAVDGLYQEQFGLAIRLESATLLDALNDPFRDMNGSVEQVLREFRRYSLDNPALSTDMGLLHLFTGSYDDNNVIGLSWINSLCRKDGYNVSVSTPFAQQMLLAAHEMAHNLGALHDDSDNCEVEYDKVMWPNISGATTGNFSACSKKAIMPKRYASCNLDNIDLGISLSLAQSSLKNNSRALKITVSNNDTARNAKAVISITTFPHYTVPTAIPKDCGYFADTLTCNHGDIAANSDETITVELSVPEKSGQIITSELAPAEFVDLSKFNNIASLDPYNAPMVNGADAMQSNAQGTGSGGGSTAFPILAFLLSLVLIRNIQAHHERGATARNRT